MRSDVKAFLLGVVMLAMGFFLRAYFVGLFSSPFGALTTPDLAVALLVLILLVIGGAIMLGSMIHWLRELFRGGPYESALPTKD